MTEICSRCQELKSIGQPCQSCGEEYKSPLNTTWKCKHCGKKCSCLMVVCPHCRTPIRDDLKWDQGKLKMTLVLPGFRELMAEILTLGEENHPKIDGNPSWQYVEPEAYADALDRHFVAYLKNPKSLDKDMNTHHMGHIAVNAMFLWWLSKNGQRKMASPEETVNNESYLADEDNANED